MGDRCVDLGTFCGFVAGLCEGFLSPFLTKSVFVSDPSFPRL